MIAREAGGVEEAYGENDLSPVKRFCERLADAVWLGTSRLEVSPVLGLGLSVSPL